MSNKKFKPIVMIKQFLNPEANIILTDFKGSLPKIILGCNREEHSVKYLIELFKRGEDAFFEVMKYYPEEIMEKVILFI